MKREWLDNGFWDNTTHTQIKAILRIEDDEGRVTTEVRTIKKGDDDNPNPDWIEYFEQYDEEHLQKNTDERIERKEKEKEAEELLRQEHEQAKKLEKLFNAKLQAFEIEEVKNSKNRNLKAKLRRSKSIIEVNIYAMMIVMEAMNESED